MSRRAAAAVVVVVALLVAAGLIVHSRSGSGSPASDRTVAGSGRTRSSSPGHATTSSQASTTTTDPPAPVWRVGWGSAMAWGYGVIDNATVRNQVTVATGGEAVRFRISNVFGNAPLLIGAGTVGVSTGASAVDPASLHPLTFGGSASTSIPVGTVAYTDPVSMAVTPGESLAVSLWVEGADLVSLHPCCGTIPRDWFTANGRGNVTSAPTLASIGIGSPFERFVDAMDVLQTEGQGSIVVVGDSITDGYNATTRWTDVLQSRVDQLPPQLRRAIVNEGITANALTSYVHTDALTGGGPSGISRLQRDALSQAGVSEIILLLGTNDLWFGATAPELIEGYKQVIAEAHAAGIPIIGMTLLPRSTSRTEYWSPTDQQELQTVNHWIATSGAFNGVIDSAKAVADVYNGQCDAHLMYPPYDSGDHLHPNAAGQTAMANAVTGSIIGLPPLPPARPLVVATPTPGCAAGTT